MQLYVNLTYSVTLLIFTQCIAVNGVLMCPLQLQSLLRVGGEAHLAINSRPPYDLFDLPALATEAGLVFVDKYSFDRANFPGYCNRRGAGTQAGRQYPCDDAVLFRFKLPMESG